PGSCGDDDHCVVEGERLARPRQQGDVPVVRRVEGAAEETSHGTNSNDSSPISTFAPRFAPASRSASSSASSLGGSPTTRKPPSTRSRLHGRGGGFGRYTRKS